MTASVMHCSFVKKNNEHAPLEKNRHKRQQLNVTLFVRELVQKARLADAHVTCCAERAKQSQIKKRKKKSAKQSKHDVPTVQRALNVPIMIYLKI